MHKQKLNPAYNLWVQCVDIDRMVALMCYIQLSLWSVPAQIIVGNTLTLEYREQFFTPAHYLFRWDYKLRKQRQEREKTQAKSEKPKPSQPPSQPMTKIVEVDEIVQFDMFENL